jgi:hypothetical protein
MQTLTLTSTRCALKHINVRKEGNEEDGLELANDLKFALQARADIALRALGCRDLVAALYDKDDNPLCPELDALHFGLELDDHDLRIDANALEFRGVTIKGIVLELRGPGQEAVLTFVAQVKPTPEEHAMVAEMLREEVVLSVVPPNTLPGVVPEGKIEGGKKGGDDIEICPECKYPIAESDDTVTVSVDDENDPSGYTEGPKLHVKCHKKRLARAAKALKKKKK